MPSRTTLAKWLWYLYGVTFPIFVVAGMLLGTLALPLIAGVPLFAVVVLSGVLIWKRDPRLVLLGLLASVFQIGIGILLLGGPGTTTVTFGHVSADPPGMPTSLQLPSVLLGVFLPVALAVYSVRRLHVDGGVSAGR